jgi:hypothetical protein
MSEKRGALTFLFMFIVIFTELFVINSQGVLDEDIRNYLRRYIPFTNAK